MKNEAFLYSYTTPRLFERHDYVRQYTPLVRRIAHQMVAKLPANVELDDMIQAGMMGLMDAICRYEESQGTQFEVYASQRVRGAMLDELRANDWLPRSARKSQRDIENAIHRLEGKLMRAPHEAEIAQELGLPIADYRDMLTGARGSQLVYLDDGGGVHCSSRRMISAASIMTTTTLSVTSSFTAASPENCCATSASGTRS